MSTSQVDRICLRCGQEYIAEFNTKTGNEEMITSCGCDKVEERLKNKIKKLTKSKNSFKKGFGILMDYWDSLPDDEKSKVNKRLVNVGL